jgi:hypothetical protein
MPTPDVVCVTTKSDKFGNVSDNINCLDDELRFYNYFHGLNITTYQTNEVIHIKDSNINFVNGGRFYGQSKLFASVRSVNLLSNVYDVVNSILSSPIGFIKKINQAHIRQLWTAKKRSLLKIK